MTEVADSVRATPRAEHVGSLLRPPELRAAFETLGAHRPGLSMRQEDLTDDQRAELRDAEDTAITEAVRRQLECGLDVVTDGEFRRTLFVNSFYDAIDGLAPADVRRNGRVWRNRRGEEIRYAGPPVMERRLEKVDSPAAREVSYVAGLTETPVKATFPAGSWFVSPLARRGETRADDYATEEEQQTHALDILRELILDAIDAGARYVQLDFPSYVLLTDPGARRSLEESGTDTQALLQRCLWADRYVLHGLPSEVELGLHVCRGNNQSSWMFEGALDPVAEQLFELPYDAFLIEWDDQERCGDFSALRYVPAGKRVVLGVVGTKHPALESADDLVRTIEEASLHLPVEQLAVSPQCGFASSHEGNLLTENDQWRKLELIGAVADRVWPK